MLLLPSLLSDDSVCAYVSLFLSLVSPGCIWNRGPLSHSQVTQTSRALSSTETMYCVRFPQLILRTEKTNVANVDTSLKPHISHQYNLKLEKEINPDNIKMPQNTGKHPFLPRPQQVTMNSPDQVQHLLITTSVQSQKSSTHVI